MADPRWNSTDVVWNDSVTTWLGVDATVADWEFYYNEVTIGGNRNIGILDVQGLSTPDVRQDTTDRVGQHGAFDFSQWLSPRYITIHGDITDSDEDNFQASVESLQRMFAPQTTEKGLIYQYPGIDARVIFCKPIKGPAFNLDRDFMILYTDWNVQLLAADPRTYASGAVTEIELNPGNSFEDIATNGGNWITPVLFTITGPGSVFTLTDGSRTIVWNGTLAGGDTCQIDTYNRTCLRNGIDDYGNIDIATEWIELPAGNTTIQATIDADDDANTAITVGWRDAWL